jgi:hypothetical protein
VKREIPRSLDAKTGEGGASGIHYGPELWQSQGDVSPIAADVSQRDPVVGILQVGAHKTIVDGVLKDDGESIEVESVDRGKRVAEGANGSRSFSSFAFKVVELQSALGKIMKVVIATNLVHSEVCANASLKMSCKIRSRSAGTYIIPVHAVSPSLRFKALNSWRIVNSLPG